ncbi:MAG: glucosidase [Bacillota bacterium]|nr:glucosidase [Bacillota bacterium]MDW7678279.1 glucosidase [Bacillota bacterium]
MSENPEVKRLKENESHQVFWKQWGPYLSERQWGTVREDYSEKGTPWEYFPHDHARSRAYRWGEDGIAGISDIRQQLCFSVALWNLKDPILKERLFGLTGTEGNHGEDVKELYYYLDNTPSHSYMKYLYKYPQESFPYEELVDVNNRRSKKEGEYELLDTGIFETGRYFDVMVEYAKKSPTDLYIRITVTNHGDEPAPLVVLPTLWFRNTWSFEKGLAKPEIRVKDLETVPFLEAAHHQLGTYHLTSHHVCEVLVTENETNTERLYQVPNPTPFVKDAFHEVFINGDRHLLQGNLRGTKASMVHDLMILPGQSSEIWLRLSDHFPGEFDLAEAQRVLQQQLHEADRFYDTIHPPTASEAEKQLQRQAFASLLWNKQYYHYEVERWLEGDVGQPKPPAQRRHGRNADWEHLFNRDILYMPDKWEYPWYASWDLAFQCIPLAMIDPGDAKKQLLLFLREWYMHPSGQIPAYEWALGDTNPPVHAWACLKVFQMDRERNGRADTDFLKRAFHKLLLNFTWWVNRKDVDGHNIFQGGFLGLDNIGLFDRSKPLPTGGHLEQADGTSWMAMFALNMMSIALELAKEDLAYEDLASKFFEHFIHISEAFNSYGEEHQIQLWDNEDKFFYDAIHHDDGRVEKVSIRSFVGLIPLFAVAVFDEEILSKCTGFAKRLKWFQQNRASLNKCLLVEETDGQGSMMLSLVNSDRLRHLLDKLLDENEFLAPGGIRSLSRYHRENPFSMTVGNESYSVAYQPGESEEGLFGGNSNWRGPVWMPVNYLLLDALLQFHHYYGNHLKVSFPTHSEHVLTLSEVAVQLSRRLTSLMLPDVQGKRAVHGSDDRYASDPAFKDLILFYEYFHGDDCRGLGASHQAGWTALAAKLVSDCHPSLEKKPQAEEEA